MYDIQHQPHEPSWSVAHCGRLCWTTPEISATHQSWSCALQTTPWISPSVKLGRLTWVIDCLWMLGISLKYAFHEFWWISCNYNYKKSDRKTCLVVKMERFRIEHVALQSSLLAEFTWCIWCKIQRFASISFDSVLLPGSWKAFSSSVRASSE